MAYAISLHTDFQKDTVVNRTFNLHPNLQSQAAELEADIQKDKKAYRAFKRIFDFLAAATLLLLLLPLFLLVAILIKLESRGPVFYAAKRVGEGYKMFDFYKFRSMRTNADSLLEKMKAFNHYGGNGTAAPMTVFSWEKMGDDMLVADEGYIAENEWIMNTNEEDKKTFVKFKNDPRITRIGKFIRNTSIDELPQLVNVLKGDMSLVGNRPLPLYEAAKLTSDEAIGRFLAPAGITGLWQVTERGKANTSADSRKQLDVTYSKEFSFTMDLKILVKTPLAALQQENV
jgi:lipopolysaccharide/colanic/teichoic acid biosynthesis glycosyltransferase